MAVEPVHIFGSTEYLEDLVWNLVGDNFRHIFNISLLMSLKYIPYNFEKNIEIFEFVLTV